MATGGVKKYREHFSKELKENGWDRIMFEGKVKLNERDRLPNKVTSEAKPEIKIFDISSGGRVEKWTIAIPQDGDDEESFLVNGRIHLSRIPADLATRIIVFSDSHQSFIRDLIGVHYSIPPAFFRALAHWRANRAADGRRDPDISRWPEYDIQLPEYITGVGGLFLNLGKGCLGHIKPLENLPNNREAKIVIGTFPSTFFPANMITSLHRSKTWASFDWNGRLEQIYTDPTKFGILMDSSELFAHTLARLTSADIAAVNDDPLLLFVPVLEVFFHLITSRVAVYRDRLLRYRFRLGDVQSEELAKEIQYTWGILAEMAFEWSDTSESFRQYDNVHNQGRTQKNAKCASLLEQHRKAIKEAVRCEQFAREMLGVYVNHFSLEDSKASIRQAKFALEDSQRSRLITILAYIFVPISIGTSIFGMNISELNNSGQPVWVFIVTTIVLAWLGTLVWAASFQWHLYYNADDLGKPGESGSGDEEAVSRSFRLQQFYELLKKGHILWAWNSGVIFSLLTSGRKSYVPTCRDCPAGDGKDEWLRPDVGKCKPHDIHSPCSYIAVHIKDKEAFRIADPEVVTKKKNLYLDHNGRPSYAYA